MAGAMFGTLLDYWRYTGDDQYNDMVREGMIHQFGENLDLVGFTVRCVSEHGSDPNRCPTISRRTKETTIRSSGLTL